MKAFPVREGFINIPAFSFFRRRTVREQTKEEIYEENNP